MTFRGPIVLMQGWKIFILDNCKQLRYVASYDLQVTTIEVK